MKTFCAPKGTSKKVKKDNHRIGENIADHMCDKDLGARMYTELLQPGNQKDK